MPPGDYRLAVLAGFTWVSIVVHIAFPYSGGWLVAAGGAMLLWGWSQSSGQKMRTLLTLAGLGLMSSAVVAYHHPLRYPPVLDEAMAGSATVTVVVEKPAPEAGSVLWGRIHSVSGRDIWPTPVMVTGVGLSHRVAPHTVVSVTGSLDRFDGMDSRAWVLAADVVRVSRAPNRFLAALDAVREDFSARAIALGGDGGALLPGLSLGQTEAVTASLEYDMRRAGLAHLVAVSGANCAIVVSLAIAAVAIFGGGVWIRLIAGVVTLVGFVVLVTPEPSVVRAAVMAGAVLCAGALGRPALGIHILSMCVWVLLLIDPWRGVEISFALSVAATGGIITGFTPITRLLQRVLPTPLAVIFALPLSAQFAVTPLLILLTPSIPTYGLIANALVAPLAPVVTVLGLLGCLLGPIAPGLADLLAWLGWWPSSAIAAIARGVGHMPLGEIPWLEGISGVVAAGVMSIGFGALALTRFRLLAGVAIALTALWVAAQTLLPSLIAGGQRPPDWQVAQCDVGQGDALLVNSDDGVIVIDTGDNERLLRQCLRLMSVSRVRLLILSHFDTDHVGQSLVFRGITEEVWTGEPENLDDRRRVEELETAGAAWRVVAEGDTLSLGHTTLQVLWPTKQPLASPGNDSSVTVVIDIGAPEDPLRLLALGDLGEQSQLMLMGRLPEGAVDIVKVSHHGSTDQSAELYQRIGARIALIGVGADNSYGHPTAQTLDLLSLTNTEVFRTDLNGTSVAGIGDEGLWVWSSGGR